MILITIIFLLILASSFSFSLGFYEFEDNKIWYNIFYIILGIVYFILAIVEIRELTQIT